MKQNPATVLVIILAIVGCQNREAYRLLESASGFAKAGRFQDAVSLYEEAVEISPDDPYLLTRAGLANLSLGGHETAIGYLERAHELAPEYIEALMGLSRGYAAVGNVGLAVETLDGLLSRSYGDVETILEAGRIYRFLGLQQEAIHAFEAGLEANQNLWRVHAELGTIYYERRSYEKAEAAYKKALELNPWDAGTMNNLAWMYAQQRILLNEALDLSNRSLQLGPDEPIYLDTLAEIYYLKGNRNRAVALIRRAIALDPESGHYRKQLEKFHATGQRW